MDHPCCFMAMVHWWQWRWLHQHYKLRGSAAQAVRISQVKNQAVAAAEPRLAKRSILAWQQALHYVREAATRLTRVRTKEGRCSSPPSALLHARAKEVTCGGQSLSRQLRF